MAGHEVGQTAFAISVDECGFDLQGHGFGAFSYLRAYRFEVRSSHSFTAVEGKTVTLQALAYEKGGVTTPLEERPAIRYSEKVSSGLADAAVK